MSSDNSDSSPASVIIVKRNTQYSNRRQGEYSRTDVLRDINLLRLRFNENARDSEIHNTGSPKLLPE